MYGQAAECGTRLHLGDARRVLVGLEYTFYNLMQWLGHSRTGTGAEVLRRVCDGTGLRQVGEVLRREQVMRSAD